jgi:hypothetical protein
MQKWIQRVEKTLRELALYRINHSNMMIQHFLTGLLRSVKYHRKIAKT